MLNQPNPSDATKTKGIDPARAVMRDYAPEVPLIVRVLRTHNTARLYRSGADPVCVRFSQQPGALPAGVSGKQRCRSSGLTQPEWALADGVEALHCGIGAKPAICLACQQNCPQILESLQNCFAYQIAFRPEEALFQRLQEAHFQAGLR